MPLLEYFSHFYVFSLTSCRLATVEKAALTHTFGLMRDLDLCGSISHFLNRHRSGRMGSFRGFCHLTNLRTLRTWTQAPVLGDAFVNFSSSNSDTRLCHCHVIDHTRSVSFADLTRLVKLESLDISSNDNIDDSNLAAIANLGSLTSLNMSGCGKGGKASVEAVCNTLTSLRNLTDLDLKRFIFAEQVKPVEPQQPQTMGGFTMFVSRHVEPDSASEDTKSRLVECLKGLATLQVLTLPQGVAQWESLKELPALRYLCLSEDDISHIVDQDADPEEVTEDLESWISRIEDFKIPILFQGTYGQKESLLCHVAGSGKAELVSVVLAEPRTNPSLAINFSAFGGYTAVFNATTPEVVEALVAAGANINATSHSKSFGVYTPFRALLCRGEPDLVRVALEQGADPFIGVAITETMDQYTPEPFNLVWERMKDRILDYDDQTLAKIVMTAFKAAVERGHSLYLEKLLPVIGETRTHGFIKAEESSIVEDYLRMWQGAVVQQLQPAIAAGVNLRLPEGPVEKSAVWHLYVKSRADETRALIKEKGLLTEAEIVAADAQRSAAPQSGWGFG
jgi:hypothetical protein